MKLVIKPAARRDMLAQAGYLAQQSGDEIARRFLDAAEQSFLRLLENPHAGAPRTFEHQSLVGLRSWPIAGFEDIRADYLSDRNNITVIRVMHGRRDVAGIMTK